MAKDAVWPPNVSCNSWINESPWALVLSLQSLLCFSNLFTHTHTYETSSQRIYVWSWLKWSTLSKRQLWMAFEVSFILVEKTRKTANPSWHNSLIFFRSSFDFHSCRWTIFILMIILINATENLINKTVECNRVET